MFVQRFLSASYSLLFWSKAQFEVACCRSLMAGCMQAGMHAGAAPWMGDGTMQMGANPAHPAPVAPPGPQVSGETYATFEPTLSTLHAMPNIIFAICVILHCADVGASTSKSVHVETSVLYTIYL